MDNYRIGFAININAKKEVHQLYEQFKKEKAAIEMGETIP